MIVFQQFIRGPSAYPIMECTVSRLALSTMRLNLIAAALFLYQGVAQTIPYEAKYKFGGSIPLMNRWEGPLVLELAPMAGGRRGKVWLRETAEGILIFSRISGSRPRYARFPVEMNSRDHVGLWLAAAPHVDMPDIGWGHQFGLTNCKEYKGPSQIGAEDCQSWAAQQVKFRKLLRRVFVRHWALTPNVSLETYASSAYRDLLGYANNAQRRELTKLEPQSAPPMQAAEGTGFSYFEILVRWSDFPPTNSLNLSRIYLAVDFCGPDDSCSSTAPGRTDGNPITFNRLDLARPQVSTITPCKYPLQGSDLFGNRHRAWYFLDVTGRPTETFSLQNYVTGYQYNPDGLSPIPIWSRYFSNPIGTSEVVCGPAIRYAAGKKIYTLDGSSPSKRSHEDDGFIDESQISVRSIADGHLLRSGPTLGTLSPFGSGQCGSCPTADLTVYHLSPETGITVAFHGGFTIASPTQMDGDIRISPDWTTVTVYSARSSSAGTEVWSSQRYCLAGSKYEECGSGPPGEPPKPRQVVFSTNQ